METSEQIDAEIQNILSAPDATYWIKTAILARRCEAQLEGR